MMRIVSPETIAAKIARARAAGTSVISIDHTLTTKGGVLTRFVKQGHLPATFGFNWDARADAVGDLTDTLVAVGPTPHLPRYRSHRVRCAWPRARAANRAWS